MILVDANLLIYAHNEASPHHAQAQFELDLLFSSRQTVALPWVVLLAFLRITTRSKFYSLPLAPSQALEVIGLWLAQPNTVVLSPGPRHYSILKELIAAVGTAGNLTTDAHLAAIAIEHNAKIWSFDAVWRPI